MRPCRLVVLALSLCAFAEAAAAQTLPIRRVVLYKHGLGYFERQGTVSGSATLSFTFKQDEMDDVLKTLTALDGSGGRIAAITYDSQKPPEMVLDEFAFDLRTDEDTMYSLLRQLRGAKVKIDVAGEGSTSGAVMGFDLREETHGDTSVTVPRLSVLTDSGRIVAASLYDLRGIEFEDPALASEIARYLAVLRSTHRRDERSVSILAQGQGERRLFVSYAIEQPVWKATYRIVVPEDDGGEVLLQGWAIVDNTSEDDWNDVELSLVSGLPVSFLFDLYTPHYVHRPELVIEDKAVADLFLGAARDQAQDKAPSKELADARKAPARRAWAGPSSPGAGGAPAEPRFEEAFEAQEAETVTREIGDLLEYKIDHPVTIQTNRSALLPIVASRVKGQKVGLYNERMRATNPLSAVRLDNTTGLTLEAGALTVLEGETYAGESYMDTLKPKETRYVTYAVDLGVKASTKYDTTSENVHEVEFVRGTLIARRLSIETKTYTFENRNPQERSVIVEHYERPGYTLRSPEEPFEKELGLYRFRVEVDPGATEKLSVVEAQVQATTWQISTVTDDQITLFLKQRMLSKEAEDMLRRVVAARAEITTIERDITETDRRLGAISQDQDRIRKNLQALGNTVEEKDLRTRYVRELAQGEDQVRELMRSRDELAKRLQTKRKALEEMIAGFALTYRP